MSRLWRGVPRATVARAARHLAGPGTVGCRPIVPALVVFLLALALLPFGALAADETAGYGHVYPAPDPSDPVDVPAPFPAQPTDSAHTRQFPADADPQPTFAPGANASHVFVAARGSTIVPPSNASVFRLRRRRRRGRDRRRAGSGPGRDHRAPSTGTSAARGGSRSRTTRRSWGRGPRPRRSRSRRRAGRATCRSRPAGSS